MQVDNVALTVTPPRHPPQPKQPTEPSVYSLPGDQKTQQTYCWLQCSICPEDSDDDIQGDLNLVWAAIHDVLLPKEKQRLADLEEFKENVKCSGEENFFGQLRCMACSRSWEGIFDNRGVQSSHLIVTYFVTYSSLICIFLPNVQ